jgi:hypothetical protein
VNYIPDADNPYEMFALTQLSQQEIMDDPELASVVATIGKCQWYTKDLEEQKAGGCISEVRTCADLFETGAEQLGRMSTRVKKVDPDEIGAKLFSSCRPSYRFIGFKEYRRLANSTTSNQEIEFNPHRTFGPSAYADFWPNASLAGGSTS